MRLADFIERNASKVLAGAEAFATTQAPAGVQLSKKELRDHLPQILEAIVRDLRTDQDDKTQRAKSETRAPQRPGPETAASHHGRTRAVAGFGLNQMVAEYRALRAAVLRLWAEDKALSGGSVEDVVRFNEAIDQAVAESLAEYSAEVESWRQIFLGALGHDLRGPLTAIVLTAGRLADRTRDTPHAQLVERVVSGGARMTELLDHLLAYSKSKLGVGMVIERHECDLAQVLGEEMDLLRAALPRTHFRFKANGATRGHFDASRVREALHNLATNAAKYGEPETDVVVTVSDNVEKVLIAVTNTGEPLSEGALHGMFNPLQRGSSEASSDEHASLGLGLFLVREIALAHGGNVTASSADGLTTFVLALPRVKA